MRRFLLDTRPAQDFNHDPNGSAGDVQAERRRGNRVGIATPVLGELWAGLGGSESRERNLHRLHFGLSRLILWPYDAEAAEEFGRLFNELKRIGRPMQQVDVQIADIVFALGHRTVVSGDSDLKAIPGLSVEDWVSEAAGHGTDITGPRNRAAGVARPGDGTSRGSTNTKASRMIGPGRPPARRRSHPGGPTAAVPPAPVARPRPATGQPEGGFPPSHQTPGSADRPGLRVETVLGRPLKPSDQLSTHLDVVVEDLHPD